VRTNGNATTSCAAGNGRSANVRFLVWIQRMKNTFANFMHECLTKHGSGRAHIENRTRISASRSVKFAEDSRNCWAMQRTYWLENKTYDVDECAVRFHYDLVVIHPFPNGNGRHARLVADVVAVKYGRPAFSWGGKELTAPGTARQLCERRTRATSRYSSNSHAPEPSAFAQNKLDGSIERRQHQSPQICKLQLSSVCSHRNCPFSSMPFMDKPCT